MHTVPTKVTGHCGSVSVRLIPAPRGEVLLMAGGLALGPCDVALLWFRQQQSFASGKRTIRAGLQQTNVRIPLAGAGIVAARTPKKVSTALLPAVCCWPVHADLFARGAQSRAANWEQRCMPRPCICSSQPASTLLLPCLRHHMLL